jgi:hypothetical protein
LSKSHPVFVKRQPICQKVILFLSQSWGLYPLGWDIIPRFVVYPTFWGIQWIPTFLKKQHDFDKEQPVFTKKQHDFVV